MEQQRKGDEANTKTSFDFAGDVSNVAYDTSGLDETITFYLQNSGEYLLDINSVFVQLDGVAIPAVDLTTTVLPNPGDWGSEDLLEVQLQGNWGYADDTDISLTVVVRSENTFGQTGSDSKSTEARLNEL
jgi:archaellum component FlaG (FlaF/FlaG flagellin family)